MDEAEEPLKKMRRAAGAAARVKFGTRSTSKGCEEEDNRRVLAEFDSVFDYEAVEADLLRRYLPRHNRLDRTTARRRLVGYLARRGYDRAIIATAVKAVWKKSGTDEIK